MGRELKVRSHEHTGIRARGSENTLKSNDNDNKKHGKKMLGAGLATHTCPDSHLVGELITGKILRL